MAECVIIVPCYNEAERLDVQAFHTFAAKNRSVQFLFVNDGSTDETFAVIEKLCAAMPEACALLNLDANAGKAEAVRQGVLSVLGSGPTCEEEHDPLAGPSATSPPSFVGYWDADLATPLAAIREFLDVFAARADAEVVIGARVKLLGRQINRRAYRHYLGRAFATAASLVLRLPIYDTQCGAKLFRASERTQRPFAAPFCSRWIFDVELLARFCRQGERSVPATAESGPAETGPQQVTTRIDPAAGTNRPDAGIYEYALHRWKDVSGSKLRARDYLRAAWELAQIAWRYGRKPKTHRLASSATHPRRPVPASVVAPRSR